MNLGKRTGRNTRLCIAWSVDARRAWIISSSSIASADCSRSISPDAKLPETYKQSTPVCSSSVAYGSKRATKRASSVACGVQRWVRVAAKVLGVNIVVRCPQKPQLWYKQKARDTRSRRRSAIKDDSAAVSAHRGTWRGPRQNEGTPARNAEMDFSDAHCSVPPIVSRRATPMRGVSGDLHASLSCSRTSDCRCVAREGSAADLARSARYLLTD